MQFKPLPLKDGSWEKAKVHWKSQSLGPSLRGWSRKPRRRVCLPKLSSSGSASGRVDDDIVNSGSGAYEEAAAACPLSGGASRSECIGGRETPCVCALLVRFRSSPTPPRVHMSQPNKTAPFGHPPMNWTCFPASRCRKNMPQSIAFAFSPRFRGEPGIPYRLCHDVHVRRKAVAVARAVRGRKEKRSARMRQRAGGREAMKGWRAWRRRKRTCPRR